MSNQKIVLTMIVKNEEHVIERALESCHNMIDSYCIVDTGSTDNTKQVIKDFFDSKNIDGKIIDFEFTNFEECRNKTIEFGKDLGDYGFWMDADEVLELDKSFNKSDLSVFLSMAKPDQILFNCIYGTLRYKRGQMYNFSSDYYWYGPVHELIMTDKPNPKLVDFTFGNMKIIPDGASWKGDLADKYEAHAEILLDYQEKNEWKDPRWTFYLANSYKDASNFILPKNPKDERGLKLAKNAIHYYKERSKRIDGFGEERYHSQLMAAKLSYYFNSNEYVINELMLCEELNFNNRCEHLFHLCSALQGDKKFATALIFAKEGLRKIKDSLKRNNTTSLGQLFIEATVYDFLIHESYGVSCYYTGNFEDALKYFKYALKNGTTKGTLIEGSPEHERLSNNIESISREIASRNKS